MSWDRLSRMTTVLVTGINGFTGRYLTEELRLAGYTVVGIGIEQTEAPGIAMTTCDLNDRLSMLSVVPRLSPDYVIHLGGIAFAAHDDVNSIYRTNILGTRNLLEALSQCPRPPTMVLLASSAHIYGNATTSPIDENTVAAPASDYAVSKLAMEAMAKLWAERLPIVIVRPFNYTGVGQSLNFLLPKIVDHFQRRATKIELGNVDVVRDFSDVRDVVHRYRLLLEAPVVGKIFNACSGTGYALKEILLMMAELSHHDLEVVVNAAFVRKNEVHKLVGSSAKLDKLIGTQKITPLRETLAWMLRYTDPAMQ